MGVEKLGVDEWLTCTVMALYTVACTVVIPTISIWLFTAAMDVVFSEAKNGLPSELLYAVDLVLMAPTMEQHGKRLN